MTELRSRETYTTSSINIFHFRGNYIMRFAHSLMIGPFRLQDEIYNSKSSAPEIWNARFLYDHFYTQQARDFQIAGTVMTTWNLSALMTVWLRFLLIVSKVCFHKLRR